MSKKSYVYIILAHETNTVKIGQSGNPKKRLATLQTASPNKLEIVGVITGSMQTEEWLHGLFRQYRRQGEWFEFPECLINRLKEGLPKLKAHQTKSYKDLTYLLLSDWQRSIEWLIEAGVEVHMEVGEESGQPFVRATVLDATCCQSCQKLHSTKEPHQCIR
jgi:T5orf172 domain